MNTHKNARFTFATRVERTARVRGIGWEFVHVAIGDCTRLAYADVLAAEDGPTTAAFLTRALAWFV